MIPNHVLILGAPNTGKLRTCQRIVYQNLEFKSVDPESHSGVIFKTDLTTKYYSLKLNLLVDEYPQERRILTESEQGETKKLEGLKKWYDEFISDDFQELREAIDGVIFCLNIDSDSLEYIESCMELFSKIREKLDEEGNDNFFSVIVGDSQTSKINEAVEDLIIPYGIEYVNLFEKGQGEFRDKIGQDRLYEIIETHEWSQMNLKQQSDLSAYEDRKQKDLNDMTEYLINRKEDEGGIESTKMDLGDILVKVQQAKDNIKNMDDKQKEAYANKTINDIIDFI